MNYKEELKTRTAQLKKSEGIRLRAAKLVDRSLSKIEELEALKLN